MSKNRKQEEAVAAVEAEVVEDEVTVVIADVIVHKVAKGRSVTSKAGQRNEGDIVTSDMFHQGAKDLESLVKLGVVVKAVA